MGGPRTVTRVWAVFVVLLGLSQDGAGAWAPQYSTSPFQQLMQRTQNPALRNGYAGSQPSVYYSAQGSQYQGYTPIKGNQLLSFNPAYFGQTVFYPQSLQYQGYSVAPVAQPAVPVPASVVPAPTSVVPAPLSLTCPTCPAPVSATACPAPVPATCPAPVLAPPCPAPVPAATCPAPGPGATCPTCPATVPAPTCPAPVPASSCPTCPDPVPAPACPVPAPTPTVPAPIVSTCAEDPFVTETKKLIMNIDNWQCATRTDAAGVAHSCVVTPTPTSTAGAAPSAHCNWIMPQFCDDTVNQLAASMAVEPPTPPPAPSDYTLVPNQGYVKLHTESKTYSEAEAICASEGTTLAIPLTPADYPPLTAMYLAALPGATLGFFVGFTDQVRNNLFDIDETGQPVCMAGSIEFQTIYFGLGGENCTVLGFYRNDLMQDVPCTWSVPFMCQQQLPSRYKLAPCV